MGLLLLHDENTRDAFYLNHNGDAFMGVNGNVLCGGKSLMTKNLQYEFKVKICKFLELMLNDIC